MLNYWVKSSSTGLEFWVCRLDGVIEFAYFRAGSLKNFEEVCVDYGPNYDFGKNSFGSLSMTISEIIAFSGPWTLGMYGHSALFSNLPKNLK